LFQQSEHLPRLINWANASQGELFSTYKAFMALHPFNDGNGRVGRLLYEYLSWKITGRSADVTLPLFDLDLLSSRGLINSYQAAGNFLNDWVSRAVTDQEFQDRAEVALSALVKIYPNLIFVLPELGEFQ
ncbi:MAG: Fic family protein, partial [Bdellovibrionaceae bacterium]|nr:Fic family protein [Pseudobdellovibrionaceae bacterium]